MDILNEKDNKIEGNWVVCQKKSYIIKAKRKRGITSVFNVLENSIVPVGEDDIILKGLFQEEWAIGESKFLSRYTHIDGSPLTDMVGIDFDWIEIKTKADDSKYLAMRIDKAKHCGIYAIPTMDKSQIKYTNQVGVGYQTIFEINSPLSISDHGDGDYLMRQMSDDEELNDIWVVDGYVFNLTYTINDEIK